MTFDFTGAITALREVLGDEGMRIEAEDIAEFRDPYTFKDWDKYVPSAVVQPASVEEVQAVVRIANEFKIPIWTNSRGKNNCYGGSAPRVNGSIVMNLARMNKIIEVNEANGSVIVEPGVSFAQLYDHFKANNIKMWVDAPDLEWGSIVGNTLDHGYGYTEYGDHASAACGMEVVLADGSLIRTGQGALPPGKSWNLHNRGFGPTADGIFMQSNFGIVTKMGVWLMPEPETWRACWIAVPEAADLGALVELVRPLVLDGTLMNIVTIGNAMVFATAASKRTDWYDGEGAMPPDVLRNICDTMDIGMWNARACIYGPEEVVEAKFRVLERAVAKLPGAKLVSRKYPGSATRDEVNPADQIPGGHPNMDLVSMFDWAGAEKGGHVGFAPVCPLTAEDATILSDMTKAALDSRGLDYGAAFLVTPRSLLLVTLVMFDTENEREVRDAYELCDLLIRQASAAGYGEYRSHPDFMDLVEAQFSFNDHALRKFNQKLKDTLDPNGILSPGRHGIWPSSMEHMRRDPDAKFDPTYRG